MLLRYFNTLNKSPRTKRLKISDNLYFNRAAKIILLLDLNVKYIQDFKVKTIISYFFYVR